VGLVVDRPEVITGTPICRRTAFALDKFLANQQEIQGAYPDCHMVLVTDEPDFVAELEAQIKRYHLKGEVITYETVKPDYARSRVWSVTCGREAIRQYALLQGAEYLLCLDGDMVYEPSLISIMKEKIGGFDAVFSGYQSRYWDDWVFGSGCVLINRKTLAKIKFRCFEFKNRRVIFEDELLEMDLFACRARIKKGIFASNRHYTESGQYYAIEPQPIGWLRTLTNHPLVKYMLIRLGILVRFNIARKLRFWTKRLSLERRR
jgi:hypothetical protein